MIARISDEITVVHGDCLQVELPVVDAVISDPPHGMGGDTDSRRFSGGATPGKRGRGVYWGGVQGDDEDFNPGPWLGYPRVVLWGWNHYASRMPPGTTLVWIKRYSFGSFLSDAEIGWMKGGCGVYCHQDASMNGAGANFQKLHPTQKPVGLMIWCLEKASVPLNGIVLDPYMGCGTTGVACIRAGRRFFGVEVSRKYFDVACERLEKELAQGRLF